MILQESLPVDKLLFESSKLSKNIDSLASDSALSEITNGATSFDTLGNLAPVVGEIVKLAECAFKHVAETEKLAKTGSIIENLSRAKELTNSLEILFKSISSLFIKSEKGSQVKALLQQFGQVLAEGAPIIHKSGKMFKSVNNNMNECINKILHRFQHFASGPFDNEVLSNVDRFFVMAFSSSSPNIRNSALAAWKATFNNNNANLMLSKELTNLLSPLAKRHGLTVPNRVPTPESTQSSQSLEEESFQKPTKPPTPAVQKKRVISLLDEDSVDYVQILPNSSAKKMKLTEHQKENFSTRRERMPFMDEDSLMGNSSQGILNNLATQFDIESSQSGKPEVTKKAETPQKVTNKAVSPKKDAKKPETPKKLKKEPSPPAKTSEVVEVPSETSVPVVESDSSTSENKEATPTKPKKRKSAIRLNFENVKDDPKKLLAQKKLEAKKDDISSSSSESDTTDSIPKIEVENNVISDSGQESECSQDGMSTRSRRSRSKAVPTKYVSPAIKRGKVKGSKKDKKTKETQALPPIIDITDSNDEAEEQAKVAEVEENKELKEIVEEKATEDKKEETSPQKEASPAKEEEDTTTVTPTKVENGEEPVCCTPLIQRVFEQHTPGILKKVNSPSNSERKRLRVHFNSFEQEERREVNKPSPSKSVDSENPILLPMKSPSIESSSPPDSPVYPQLKDNTEPILKIINKLLPIANTGAMFLKRTLEAKGIATIGDMAMYPKNKACQLPIRKPRLQTITDALFPFYLNVDIDKKEKTEVAEETTEDKEISDVEKIVDSPEKVPEEPVPATEVVEEDRDTAITDVSSINDSFKSVAEGPCKYLQDFTNISTKLRELNTIPDHLNTCELKELMQNVNNTTDFLHNLQKQLLERIMTNL